MLSVGEILQKTREKKGITLLQAEKVTRIRRSMLQAIEENNWDSFSSKIYITGVIRNYSKFLGLDANKVLAFFRRDYEKKEDNQFNKRMVNNTPVPETRRFVTIALYVVFLLFSIYFGYQLKIYLTPPKISITSPVKTTFRSTDRVHITGKTEKESLVTIFGEKVFINKDGVFEYDFPLKKGKNTITIEVVGPNGRKNTLQKVYLLE